VNSRNSDGDTPLIFAVRCGHAGLVKLLLEKGADASVKACAVKLPCIGLWVTDRLMKYWICYAYTNGMGLNARCAKESFRENARSIVESVLKSQGIL